MRNFLYLDERLVDQFLAQLEDGLYDDQRERSGRASSHGGGAGLGAGPARLDAKIGKESSGEVELVRRQTPESRFNRLYDRLDLARFDEQSGGVFGQLQTRQLIEADCYVDVPSFSRAFADPDALTGMAELMRTFAPEQVDPETDKMLQMMSGLGAKMSGSIVATGELGASEPTLAFKIDRSYLRVALEELEGEALVVGKVDRKWPEGESYPLLSLPGLNLFSRADRRAMAKSGDEQEASEDTILKGPGATVTVLAIYR